MKVSLNVIKQYVDLKDLTPEEIAHRLTFAGVEVESIDRLASGTNLVVGEVLTCENMPDSDHLHLTTVDAGPKYGILHIVCGAPNVRKGLKVIVATDGAKLPGGTIKKGQIRGHESEGMLCSLLELGVDAKFLSEEQTKGIEELKVGNVGDENVLELLGLDDVILDLKLLANRSDLYSLYNVAKEIETLFDTKANIPELVSKSGLPSDFLVKSETKACSQFSGKVIKGITVKESPEWMKQALRSSGIRSINNIVDIGNYVMLLTGQPLHMYDLDKLPKEELIVRDDIEGDFVALDEKHYALQKGDVCITSAGRVMCLGGVMGSLECAVDERTRNVVIEAANFDFASIRRTSIRLALGSDSSQRFIKGINPNQYVKVMALTTKLLEELCDAKEVYETKTYLEKPYVQTVLETSFDYINHRLGTSFTSEEIIEALEKAFIKVEDLGEGRIKTTIPCSRIDITSEADLSEEVIRIRGFENVKSELPEIKLSVGGLGENLSKKRQVRNYLRGVGLDELLCYSLVNEAKINSFNYLNKEQPYKVMNPLSDDHSLVRTNILPSLIETLLYNVNHNNDNLAFFEVSDLFSEDKKHIHLGVVLYGNDLRRGHFDSTPYGYYHIKGIVDGLIKLFDIDEKRTVLSRLVDESYHPGRSALIKVDGKPLAVFGELHPNKIKELGLKSNAVAVMEMDLDVLFAVKVSAKKMVQISRFPAIERDLAFVLKDEVLASDVIREIKKAGKDMVKNVEVFDVYSGLPLAKGTHSLAVKIRYESLDRTFTSDEITKVENDIIVAIGKKFSGELRK